MPVGSPFDLGVNHAALHLPSEVSGNHLVRPHTYLTGQF